MTVPGNVKVEGTEIVQEPEAVIGDAPVTVSWLAVPTRPALVTVPLLLPDPHAPVANTTALLLFKPKHDT